MSFYSYKNANPGNCPCAINGDALSGLSEKVCNQTKRVYDSGLIQQQLSKERVTITSYAVVPTCNCTCGGNCCQNDLPDPPAPVAPITFESCRSATSAGKITDLTIERLCDRPCFARVRGTLQIPIDILFSDSRCVQYVGQGSVEMDFDVLLSIPDEAIVPYCIEAMVSAICVSGTYEGDNVFKMDICVTAALKVIAEVEILVPSYGFCTIPPSEEFAENVCDEFFSLPLYPPSSLCDDSTAAHPNCGCVAQGNTCGQQGCGGTRTACACSGSANSCGCR